MTYTPVGSPLSAPLRLFDVYARPGEEKQLFPGHTTFLPFEEVIQLFPSGYLRDERFVWRSKRWRVIKSPSALLNRNGQQGPSAAYLIVPDDHVMEHSHSMPNASPSRSRSQTVVQHSVMEPQDAHDKGLRASRSLSSVPLEAIDAAAAGNGVLLNSHDIVDGPAHQYNGASSSSSSAYAHSVTHGWSHLQSHQQRAPAGAQQYNTSAAGVVLAPPPGPHPLHGMMQPQLQQQHRGEANALALMRAPSPQNSGYPPRYDAMNSLNGSAHIHPHHHMGNGGSIGGGGQRYAHVMADLVTASDSPVPLERYKAFVRLFAALHRQRSELWEARRQAHDAALEAAKAAAAAAQQQQQYHNANGRAHADPKHPSSGRGREAGQHGQPHGHGFLGGMFGGGGRRRSSGDSSGAAGSASSSPRNDVRWNERDASTGAGALGQRLSGGPGGGGIGIELDTTPLDPRRPEAWACCQESQELLRRIVLVGEALAKFGTASFFTSGGGGSGTGGDNASRALTTRDYAQLLRLFLQDHGLVFHPDFIAGLPPALADEVLSIATLLQTRCEAAQVLYDQLVKHVGLEQRGGGGGALVINTSTVTANPVNRLMAAPTTNNWVQAASNALAKCDARRRMQLGGAAAVAVVALFLFGKRLRGGGRGRDRDRDDRMWPGAVPLILSDQRGSPGPTAVAHLTERRAVRHLASCEEQLRRAARNDALLQADWRLGPIRLAMPGSGPVPAGYSHVDYSACTLGRFLDGLDGVAPPLPPPSVPEQPFLQQYPQYTPGLPMLTAPPLADGVGGGADGSSGGDGGGGKGGGGRGGKGSGKKGSKGVVIVEES